MKYLLMLATLVIAVLFFFWKDAGDILPAQKLVDTGKEGKLEKKRSLPEGIDVLQKWDLPSSLREVSGIGWLDEERFAAIQDEVGTIFIYNRKTNRIEREISFGGEGDYEGLALKNNVAYVVTGDGSLYEVNMTSTPIQVKEHNTSLTAKDNVEGLCYDADNNRLLLAVKDHDPNSNAYKGIYAFDLSKNQFSSTPVYRIKNNDPVFEGDKKNKKVMPSSIGIHPVTKEIYITDGPNARLLILTPEGKPVSLTDLGGSFAQPEGITFSPAGNIYISNEGKKDAGNIIEVRRVSGE